jgi:hypothetical protein
LAFSRPRGHRRSASGYLPIRATSAIRRPPVARLIKGCRGGGEVLNSTQKQAQKRDLSATAGAHY